MMIAINPIWAEIIGKEMADIADVQACLWKFASMHADLLHHLHREELEKQGRIRDDGRIYLTPEPKDILVFVAGGLGGLHATGFHTFGTSWPRPSQSRRFALSNRQSPEISTFRVG